MSGIILAGFGFGPFVFNYVSTALVNPNHEQANKQGFYPIDVANRVPYMIRTLDICWVVIAAVGILLIFPYDDTEDKKRLAEEAEAHEEQLL